MFRMLGILILTSLSFLASATPDDLPKKPITTDKTEIGRFLRSWYAEGTAAGNVGDWYDNRDGEHSPLDLSLWPQLQKVAYGKEDVQARRHWALQPRVLPHVAFGNSSTSAPPQFSGSNPRTYYCVPAGLALLQKHYERNNLYIYPEHRDHDPGHNGVGDGYGDLYPTNTPFLIISQGSSGSDQPFMRALPFVLAAFRPEVKKRLVAEGLLMPTVQMIFRSSNNHLKQPWDYLTGKAHPTVFEGSWVDPLAMVKKAHAVRLNTIPPLVKLAVVEEDTPVNGKDYFEPPVLSERLADTPTVIARVWRGAAGRRRLLVKATDSVDVNKSPLTFRWVVLRGDEKRIQITPRDKAGTSAEVIVDYTPRRPISPGSAMASNRVDIGVFASNGVYHSAPAFITFFTLDSESRTYDKGRPVEIAHGNGITELRLPEPVKLLSQLSKDGPAAKLLDLNDKQRGELARVSKSAGSLEKQRDQTRLARKEAEDARNKASTTQREAEQKHARAVADKKDRQTVAAASQAAADAKKQATKTQTAWQALEQQVQKLEAGISKTLNDPSTTFPTGPLPFVTQSLQTLTRSPTFWQDHPDLAKQLQDRANAARRPRIAEARSKLVRLGIIADEKGDGIKLTPVRSGKLLTAFEKAMLEEFNAVVLAELALPNLVQPVFHVNFVDARLTAPKRFRDVYHYDGNALTGWTRYNAGKQGKADYTAEGWRVLKTDDNGRPVEACTVEYRQAPPPRGTPWGNPNPLEPHDGDERIKFRYKNGKRQIERRKKVETLSTRAGQ